MDTLKKFWPLSFKTIKLEQLIVRAIVYTIVPVLLGIFVGFTSDARALCIILNIISFAVVDPYCLAGAVFTFLNFFKVGKFKD